MTAKARATMARVLGLEVALLRAEVELLEELIARGILPPGARRTPTSPELRAGVRFAELDRIVNDAAALLARKADRVRDKVLDGLAEGLANRVGDPDPWAALEDLAALTDPTDPAAIAGLADTIAAVEDEVTDDLIATARAGHAEAIGEARRQGLPDRLLPLDDDPATPAVRAAARAQAKTVAQAPATRLLDVAAKAGSTAATRTGATGDTVLEAALDAAETASRKGTEDAARQAANVTHGLGRAAAQAALPDPREVYASELLDSSTCGPCATVDGRTYTNLDAGLVDYPGAGGYIGCEGGSRCRGTLVLVHKTEAPPTLDNPGAGPGSPGGPADRTPQGPTNPGRPAHIDADGNLIPTPVDQGIPDTMLDVPGFTAPVDPTTGRTTIPTDLEPQVTTVAPDTVDRDPELARLSDADLDAIMVDPFASPARQLAAADEYDQRTAGNRSQVWDEEDLDPETLARYEREREAWERGGGSAEALEAYVPKAAGEKPKGRAIDRVRQAWADESEMRYLDAEDATVGYFIAREKAAEYAAKYGNDMTPMLEGPAHVAYYYSSRELRDYWESIGGRPTFAEFAVERGIGDAKMRGRAAAAKRAKDDAALRADESASGRARRAAAKARKPRRTLTAGDRLVLEQKRRDRLRAQERKATAQQARDDDLDAQDAANRAAADEAAERAAQEAAEEAARVAAAEEAARVAAEAAARFTRIETASTPPEVGAALQQAIGNRGTVTGFDLTTLDVEKVRKAALAAVRQFDAYPLVNANVTIRKINNSRVMAQASAKYVEGTGRRELYDLELQVSASKMGKRSKLDDSFTRCVDSGHFHATTADAEDYIIAHEFGHLVDFSGRSATGGVDLDALKLRALDEAGIVAPPGRHPLYHADGAAYFRDAVSGYGRSDRDELVAEAFADVDVNGEGAKPFSRMVVDAFVDRLEQRRGLPDA